MDISVVIPAYNRVDTIARAVESVLRQSYEAKEIIVVDDGSSDATSEVVKRYDGVLLLRQKNMGVSAARNNGVMMSSSKWIAFLDSDDTWHKEKLAKQVAFHKQNITCKASYTDEEWRKNDLHVNVPKRFKKPKNDMLYERMLEDCVVAASSLLIEKSLFESLGGFDESFAVCEDYDFYLRLLHVSEISLIDEKLITKHAGAENQLGFTHTMLDRWRVRALASLHADYPNDEKIVATMRKKYAILLENALKYGEVEAAQRYRSELASI